MFVIPFSGLLDEVIFDTPTTPFTAMSVEI
jgi:hypothetical protein